MRDEVEDCLMGEGDNVKVWQIRLKTAIEQVLVELMLAFLGSVSFHLYFFL